MRTHTGSPQERAIAAAAVLWLPKVMVLCNAPPHGTGPHELRFYPRYHLDDTSLLCRHPLRSAPLALDTQVRCQTRARACQAPSRIPL